MKCGYRDTTIQLPINQPEDEDSDMELECDESAIGKLPTELTLFNTFNRS